MRNVAVHRICRLPPNSGPPPVRVLASSGTEAVPLPVATLVVAEKCQLVLGSLVC
jgi:hypothetical protein